MEKAQKQQATAGVEKEHPGREPGRSETSVQRKTNDTNHLKTSREVQGNPREKRVNHCTVNPHFYRHTRAASSIFSSRVHFLCLDSPGSGTRLPRRLLPWGAGVTMMRNGHEREPAGPRLLFGRCLHAQTAVGVRASVHRRGPAGRGGAVVAPPPPARG